MTRRGGKAAEKGASKAASGTTDAKKAAPRRAARPTTRPSSRPASGPVLAVEVITRFQPGDLHDLCDAAEDAIAAGGGFGWVSPPERSVLENYWKGILMVPERLLIVARIDGVICGSAQLVRPAANNEAQAFAVQLQHAFLAPWSRGHGLARLLTQKVETIARTEGFDVITLDVRSTQARAIRLYESMGYLQWGRNPFYARVDGALVAGLYYFKDMRADEGSAKRRPRDKEKAE